MLQHLFSRLRPRKNKQGADTVQKASCELHRNKVDEGPTVEKTNENLIELNSLQSLACQIQGNLTFRDEKV